MKIIACFKAVPDTDSITVNPDLTLAVDGELFAGQYDYNALEAAAQLKAAIPDSSVIALTVCASEKACTSKIKKAVLSRGADELFAVCDPVLKGADSLGTAQVLKAAVEKIGGADVVICGEGSGDAYCQQTGAILGGLLGWTTLNAISSLKAGDGCLVAERALEGTVEYYEISVPAALSVTSDINIPRLASLKDIMAAGRKPSTVWSLADVACSAAPGLKKLSVLAPKQRSRKREIVKGDDDAAVAELYSKLRKLL